MKRVNKSEKGGERKKKEKERKGKKDRLYTKNLRLVLIDEHDDYDEEEFEDPDVSDEHEEYYAYDYGDEEFEDFDLSDEPGSCVLAGSADSQVDDATDEADVGESEAKKRK